MAEPPTFLHLPSSIRHQAALFQRPAKPQGRAGSGPRLAIPPIARSCRADEPIRAGLCPAGWARTRAGTLKQGDHVARTVGDFVIGRLADWGVRRIYGYPGDGINGLMGALERATDRVRFIQVRHEEMAAF